MFRIRLTRTEAVGLALAKFPHYASMASIGHLRAFALM
jgi:hypothetical protein